jgi:hypothetical protein
MGVVSPGTLSLVCALISSLLAVAQPAQRARNQEPPSKAPLCRNGSHLLVGGNWHLPNQAWAPDPAQAGCRSAGLTGVAALEALRGTHFLFVGDSMLRQVSACENVNRRVSKRRRYCII